MHRWLIRNSANKILGPISKTLLRELIKKGLLKDSDEVAIGNGHWFYMWEKDLVDRYIHGEMEPVFNPVSNTKSVIIDKDKIGADPSAAVIDLENISIKDKPKAIEQNEKEKFSTLELENEKGSSADADEDDSKYPSEEDLTFPELNIPEELSAVDEKKDRSFELDVLTSPAEILSTSKEGVALQSANNAPDQLLKLSVNTPNTKKNLEKKPAVSDEIVGRDDRFLFIMLYLLSGILLCILIEFISKIVG